MKLSSRKLVGFFLLLAVCMNASAQPVALDGPTLAQKVYDREDGKDSYATVRMLLVDKRGRKRFRSLITATKEYGEIQKSYIRFTSPADIDGTSFLTWENEDRGKRSVSLPAGPQPRPENRFDPKSEPFCQHRLYLRGYGTPQTGYGSA